jgi:hypothetical protein
MRYLAALAATALTLTAADTFLRDDSLVSAVEFQLRKIQPTRAERRFDEIGWAPDLAAAEAAAKKVNRPVYLFTYDGKIDTGRC